MFLIASTKSIVGKRINIRGTCENIGNFSVDFQIFAWIFNIGKVLHLPSDKSDAASGLSAMSGELMAVCSDDEIGDSSDSDETDETDVTDEDGDEVEFCNCSVICSEFSVELK